jgi:hypothetical protein
MYIPVEKGEKSAFLLSQILSERFGISYSPFAAKIKNKEIKPTKYKIKNFSYESIKYDHS